MTTLKSSMSSRQSVVKHCIFSIGQSGRELAISWRVISPQAFHFPAPQAGNTQPRRQPHSQATATAAELAVFAWVTNDKMKAIHFFHWNRKAERVLTTGFWHKTVFLTLPRTNSADSMLA